MPVYVLHEGRLIDKRDRPAVEPRARSDLPAPAVQSFEAYPSPIDDRTISSHRQRDRDLYQSGSYDKRDTPASFKKARHARQQYNRKFAAVAPRYS